MLGLMTRVMLALECAVCLQIRKTDIGDDIASVAMFGTRDRYAACPACYREMTPAARENPEYRRRVRVFLFNRDGIVLRVP